MTRDLVAFQRKVAGFVAENRLFAGIHTLLVGVSGGADSVALLDWLVVAGPRDMVLKVAHLNHCLRGDEADADEAFVAELARRYDLELLYRREDVAALAQREGLSVEEAGREARYRFFFSMCDAHEVDAVAVAHHADDQAETILLRLLRGGGTAGMAAMRPRSLDGRVLRPLLSVRRAEIEAYLQGQGLEWRSDATNDDRAFLRNRVRHELLPLLTTYNPAITERLWATADILAEDDAALHAAASERFDQLAQIEDEQVRLSIAGLQGAPRALRRRLVRLAIAHVQGTCRQIGFDHLKAVEGLLSSGVTGRTLHLPLGCRVERVYGDLLIRRGAALPSLADLTIVGPGSYHLGDGRMLAVTTGEGDRPAPLAAPAQAVFNQAAVPFPWTVRYFRPGDRFVPSGMTGHQKLKAFFINRKVPREERHRVPILESDGNIFWLAGHRPAAGVERSADNVPWVAVTLMCHSPSLLPE